MAKQPFNLIIKPAGAQCNLACEYCFFLKKERLYPGSDFRMSEKVLETLTRQYMDSQPEGEVFFTWQGGEPTLMGKPFFEKALEFQKQSARPGQRAINALQTNGHLLNDEWCSFLKANDFLVGLSMDGPAEMHDAHRKDKAGHGSHAKALAGLELLKKYEVDTNILACVSDANVRWPLEVYRYFRDTLGMQHLQFIPIVERANTSGTTPIKPGAVQRGEKLTARSISGKEYGNFLTAIFDEWVRYDVGSVFVQLFEACVGVWMGYPASICIFNETCGDCLALEHTGDLYACDHYVQPDALLGNTKTSTVEEMASSNKQKEFGSNKKALLPNQCLRCDVRFMCNGGCPKNRILPPKGESLPVNHLCEGYQAFFRHVDQPMKLIAGLIRAGRPAQEIMQLEF
ncbi:MAG: anaerobic sulfatase maturase [Chloroflexi bacterium]|nr:anaerobic sulfatase maturase [Chloroflexota bacterium]